MVAIGKSQSYGNSSRCSRRSNLQFTIILILIPGIIEIIVVVTTKLDGDYDKEDTQKN